MLSQYLRYFGSGVEPKRPAWSVYQSVGELHVVGGNRGLAPGAMSTFGGMIPEGERSMLVAKASSPAMCSPSTPDLSGKKSVEEWIKVECQPVWDRFKDTLPFQWDTQMRAGAPYMPKNERHIKAYSSGGHLRLEWEHAWLAHHLNALQSAVTDIIPPSDVVYSPIGSVSIQAGSGAVVHPNQLVQFDRYRMKLAVPDTGQKMGIRKSRMPYHGLLAVALRDLDNACRRRSTMCGLPEKYDVMDVLALSGTLAHMYGGVKDPPETAPRWVDDIYPKLASYLGLPYSLTYAGICPPGSGKDDIAIVEALFRLNIALWLVAERAGGTELTFGFRNLTGPIRMAQREIADYIKPPYDLGGTSKYLHPPVNTGLQDAILFPGCIRRETEKPTVFELSRVGHEEFEDIEVAQRRIRWTPSPSSTKHARFVVSMDAVYTEFNQNMYDFGAVEIPLMYRADNSDAAGGALSYLIAYMANSPTRPGGVVPVSDNFCRFNPTQLVTVGRIELERSGPVNADTFAQAKGRRIDEVPERPPASDETGRPIKEDLQTIDPSLGRTKSPTVAGDRHGKSGA